MSDPTAKPDDKIIKQEELKEFFVIKKRMEADEERHKTLRQSFIDRVGMGAKVESGPLVLDKTTFESNRVNMELLLEEVAKRLGEDAAKQIKKLATKKSTSDRVSVDEIFKA